MAHQAPGGINLMLLLSDGTVMAANADGVDWYRLTPDSQGSYVNGTWTTRAPMHDARLYFSSQVLKDGRVFVAGGEYGAGGVAHSANSSTAEVYDPVTNVWTLLPNSGKDFYDSVSEILPNGNVLVAPVITGGTVIFIAATNTWTNGPSFVRGSYQDEASWVKLPDNSILTIDPFGTNSERYIPSSNTWINDGVVPVSLYDPFGSELGAAFLLPNGKAFFLGSTGHTALYTPSGTNAPGTWVAGPDIPDNKGTPDAPGAMMATGKILCAVSPAPTDANHFPSPTTFYEYDPVANSFTSVSAPNGSIENGASYATAMLDLPDGTVLFSHFSTQLYSYRPSGTPLAAGKPVITSINTNPDGSYHLVGTGLNGISEGAAYGDDLQMASNYPLVRLTDAGGIVYYARTYNWSSTGVQTGLQSVTVEYKVPPSLVGTMYSLVVVANGIASDPVSSAGCTLSVVQPPNGAATCGASYTSSAPSFTGGLPPITWSLGAGAPAGMTINPSTGVVSWPTPITTGSPFTITTTGSDSCGSDSRSWILSVNPSPPSINSMPDVFAVCGSTFTSVAPTASGGVAPFTWSLVDGPPGTTIDSTTGVVTCPNLVAPGGAITYTVTIQTTSSGGCGTSASRTFNITIYVGDFNGDGTVDEADIPGFTDDLLANPASQLCAGDVNGDGNVDGLDIQTFDEFLGL